MHGFHDFLAATDMVLKQAALNTGMRVLGVSAVSGDIFSCIIWLGVAAGRVALRNDTSIIDCLALQLSVTCLTVLLCDA
jgi:hypothetical protein